MLLKDLARRARYHDWASAYSDDGSVHRRAAEAKAELVAASKLSKNHARVWELAVAYESNFTWSVKEGEEPRKHLGSREEVHEAAWRWAGAYLWAHGVRVSEEEAKSYVGAVDAHYERNGKHWSSARTIDWARIDAVIKGLVV